MILPTRSTATCGYHILDQDLWGESGPVLGETSEPIDLMGLLRGRTLPMDTASLTIRLAPSSGDARPDLLGYLLPLVSGRLRRVLDDQRIDTIDYRQADLVDRHGRVATYWLANVLGLVRCVAISDEVPAPDADRGLGAFSVDPERADGARLFRLGELSSLLIVDQELRDALAAAGLRGVRLRATEDYDGY